MKLMQWFVAAVLLFACASVALGQAKPEEHPTVSQIMERSLHPAESEFVSAAEAMPEDKYSFAPSNGEFKGVRTFAQQVKHVAAVNYIVGAAILQVKPPVELGGENGPESITTKADIVKFLKDSFAYLSKSLASINEKNETETFKNPFGEGTTTKLGFATVGIWHPFDHYGQIVEYLRMNGIVPPASRR